MNQEEKSRLCSQQPLRRSFHVEAVDLERGEVRWALGRPAPVQENVMDAVKLEVSRLDCRPEGAPSEWIVRLPAFKLAQTIIEQAVREKQHVVVYGDFDCDGVTSLTLMRDALLAMKLPATHVHLLVPPRLIYGYGVHWDFIRPEIRKLEESDQPPGLFIAVDCGSSGLDQLKKILADGLSVVVIDHHELSPGAAGFRRQNFAHLNPKLQPDAVMLHDLCAAGLVYLFAAALLNESSAWDRERALLLAGLATCVDVVPLKHINRWLLKESLKLANKPDVLRRVPGLYWMAKRPRSNTIYPLPDDIYYAVDEYTYGFEWGPCLNAPGRMSTATMALRVLLATEADEKDEVRALVDYCREMNQWRRATNQAIEEVALEQARKKMLQHNPSVLFIHNATWHPGVVGIVAARIKEKYHRPAIVCTLSVDGKWRGSGRSIKNLTNVPFDMGKKFHEAMHAKKILRGGGHKMAGGLTLTWRQLRGIEKWLRENSGLKESDFKPRVKAYASASTLTPGDWWSHFESLRPFGGDNPCPPLIVERAELKDIRTRTKMPSGYQRDESEPADGFELKSTKPAEPKEHGEITLRRRIMNAKPRPVVWAYEATFLDLSTGKLFFAHWMDLKQAEELWDIKNFLLSGGRQKWSYVWPRHFTLELQLQSFLRGRQQQAAENGKQPRWEYNFRILQCLPRPRPPGQRRESDRINYLLVQEQKMSSLNDKPPFWLSQCAHGKR